ncbi:MAG: hypothetical protein LC731_04490 [Acidobacteria bacterium]|nr:hypothetical protein [Acidobacteriota bacterium]
MKDVKQILKATILGTLPIVVFTYLLSYTVGGVPILDVIEIWGLMILISANLLLLLNRLITGGPKKWAAILITVMTILFVTPIFARFRSASGNLYFYYILGALLLLNLIVHLVHRRPGNK